MGMCVKDSITAYQGDQLRITAKLVDDANSEPMNQFLRGSEYEGKWGSPEAILPVLRRGLEELPELQRGRFAYLGMFAARHGDPEMALAYLRREYDDIGLGSYYLMWHPALREVRETHGFKSFVRDLGLLGMWQTTGQWNDYCHPLGETNFECQ